ncbi:ribonuclease D [Bathymodiolus platifrons methanotrophic gill symbiont]|uniref:ribonuclease D n=1 Tax=Bathymodiolus platifrons methanotrophic gill symbiont TaxID=113268 RepID=UPI0011C8053C|nr:ribonuclease D [Bathymodiolus platifrons methanotrophic gill symbiont]MCK5869953.1 ribonuclease D [Methyloprofundus sp.]TXK97264.1 ribonuclease D [Methylococcaceae bacterium CS4]TXK97749.1 ribonuclease D [Methylococcaceae bacterium HT1]TXL08657.1 ribonuclease D [Methylococcaceae bacterium CS1]TXL08701.1 ribonuclease D [Methylococcaceae bacterium CS3]TXL12299.1 ribonuclease D [Methylococcaceae bacterium CS2]TXL15783.1 ribonuclease D [Methylococcaceae bacterium HT3]TXL22305.1 ribonuclease 
MNEIQFIDSVAELQDLCQKMKSEPWLAIDTEFLREKTYYPKFCLLQIATLEWVACVDPIALEGHLDELFSIINDPAIIKVLHSCRQDVEIFYQLSGKLPAPVYDTQIVAPLLGFQENTGYAMLVSGFLNINLSKIHTRTDWSQRPLSADQVQYAADDVIYLAQIYQMMQQKLQALGRQDWLKEDFEQLMNEELYDIPPENAWLKIRGKNKLTGKQLAIVQVLAEWREQVAKKDNRPKNWILRDELILDMAKLQPDNLQSLSEIRGMNDGFVRRSGKQICQLIVKAKDLPGLKLKSKGSNKKTQQQEAVLDILTGVVRLRADENSLNPVILATRKELEQLILDDQDSPLLHGWRYSMVGQELQELLLGKVSVSIDKQSLSLQAIE